MTQLIGYMVRDPIDDLDIYKGYPFVEDFGPDGVMWLVGGHPSEKHSPSRRREFTEEATSVYTILRKRGFEDILMAMTLYSDAFDDYELKFLDREADPASHDDWLALHEEVYAENFRLENEFYERYRTPKARIAKVFKSKKKRVELKTKGVLAVARIRSNLKDVSGG